VTRELLRLLSLVPLLACAAVTSCDRARAAAPTPELKVCADPNNLPFSNDRREGFENKIAEIVAHDMNAKVRYTWWAQRRGFVRNTLNAGECDLLIGVPSSFERTSTTIPYYRSTYVFVTRRDRHIRISSFDDAALRKLRIGVQMIGDDFTNTPPAHALSKRNIIQNVRGYSVYGDYRQPNPPARIIDALVRGDIDIAIAWGPLAGYFAKQAPVALDITAVSPQIDLPYLPFVFDISMGVRRGEPALRDELNSIINRRKREIDRILDQYGVPRVNSAGDRSS
jgi:quinoprotein dehydrogenase-associated probable ABC transporter substrate-binding protein